MHQFSTFADNALPGYGGAGRTGRGGKERAGRNPAGCLDRQTPAKADVERQVTHCTPNFILSIGLRKKKNSLPDA